MTSLHITNGDSTIELLDAANVPGEKLAWRDVLHEGPVPETESLAELSKIRATFIAERGWSEVSQVFKDFQSRDAVFDTISEYEAIYLWFEHDLYDQLQIIQILSEWQLRSISINSVLLINPNRHLGYHTPDEIPKLFESAKPVTNEQLALSVRAWHAFRQSTPSGWCSLLDEDLDSLPYLKASVLRMLQELPDSQTGLSKSETLALSIISNGIGQKGPLFREYCNAETDSFMGDWSFFHMLDELVNAESPLLSCTDNHYQITDYGHEVLTGRQNRLNHAVPKRDFGGYQQLSRPCYFWDEGSQQLVFS